MAAEARRILSVEDDLARGQPVQAQSGELGPLDQAGQVDKFIGAVQSSADDAQSVETGTPVAAIKFASEPPPE